MNLFNRIVMVLLTATLTLASLALVFASLLAVPYVLPAMRDAIGFLDENLNWGSQLLIAAVAGLLAVFGFLLFLLEVVPRRAKGVKLTGVTGASAELTIETITSRIRYEGEAVPDVRSVKPVVRSRGKEVDVKLEVRTDPLVEATAKTQELTEAVHDAVENKLGIRLRKLRIYVYNEPFPKDSRGKTNQRATKPSEPILPTAE